MVISEQEIINAICLHTADRKSVKPTDVEVELMYDDDYGFSAEVYCQGRNQILIQANILEALERYLYQHHQMRVFRDQIQLQLADEIYAQVAV